MKKKRYIILSLFLFVLVLGIAFVCNKDNTDNLKNNNVPKQIVQENTLSMMLETVAGSGEYEMTTQSSWPTDGYVFNATLSKCENGSELSWDDEKKIVSMTGNMTDKCYVYFDKLPSTLGEYVISQYNGNQGNNNIYYHDSGLTNGAGDNSYRYAGASDSVNNYVCFGSEDATCPAENLYRIIGVFGEQVKLIKATAATSSLLGTDGAFNTYGTNLYMWSSLYSCPSSTTSYIDNDTNGALFLTNRKDILAAPLNEYGCNLWEYSDLNTINLNANFVTNIGTKWAYIIEEFSWKVGGTEYDDVVGVIPSISYQNEVGSTSPSTIFSAKIGLMYISDYEFAASPSAWTLVGCNSDSTKDYRAATNINWLYLGAYEWLISHTSSNTEQCNVVNSNGVVSYGSATDGYAVRPTFYLNSSVSYVSGSGTSTDPIRIN